MPIFSITLNKYLVLVPMLFHSDSVRQSLILKELAAAEPLPMAVESIFDIIYPVAVVSIRIKQRQVYEDTLAPRKSRDRKPSGNPFLVQMLCWRNAHISSRADALLSPVLPAKKRLKILIGSVSPNTSVSFTNL